MKKLHPNVRVIIQKPVTKPPETSKSKPLPKQKVSTQSCQTKEADRERFLSPEVASKIIKFAARADNPIVKHLTFNGYEFRHDKSRGNNKYWRCKSGKTCSCTLAENVADGTWKRGLMGWAMDGVTHLSHPPDCQKLVYINYCLQIGLQFN